VEEKRKVKTTWYIRISKNKKSRKESARRSQDPGTMAKCLIEERLKTNINYAKHNKISS
jgi:hypothetical protein